VKETAEKTSARTVARRSSEDKATIDFETRSACDLLKQGGWVYSEHESTEAMCLAYKLPGQVTKLWHMAHPQHMIFESPPPEELFDWIAQGGLVEAHNAFFERAIWANVMHKRHGWPAMPHLQWRCSAAKASTFALPRALDGAGAALGLPVEKDQEGRRIMLKLSKPRKPRKAERAEMAAQGINPDEVILWHEDEEDLEKLWSYCMTDVDAEHELSLSLRDLTPFELELWQMDQEMNERGVHCDVRMAREALRLAKAQSYKLNAELSDLTAGEVKTASSRMAFVDWVNRQDVPLPDTQGPTLEEFAAKEDVPDTVRAALKIVKDVNRTSIRKYDAMLKRAASDDTLKDTMMYHGASTGRWAGKGVQPHNFPRGTIKDIAKDIDTACEAIRTGDRTWIELLYGGGSVLEVLSCALRGALTARQGKELVVADYSAIEARVVFWLAGAEQALDVFRKGEDIYCDMASGIYGYAVNKAMAEERQMGKQSILGLGFGMGFLTFLLTCRKYDIVFSPEQARKIVGSAWKEVQDRVVAYFHGKDDLERKGVGVTRKKRLIKEGLDYDEVLHELVLMQFIVDRYRSRYPEVAQMWKDLEQGALMATQNRGRVVKTGKIEWKLTGRFLHAKLPSGRLLSYCDPKVVKKKTPWGAEGQELTFMGVDPYSKKWTRLGTYGGMLCENVVQATARDLMAAAMLRVHKHPIYDMVMSVHDELVAEADLGAGDVGEFEELISMTPPWAQGCPVTAEGWKGLRYRK